MSHRSIHFQGKFIETAQCGGYLYGITREAVESVARKGLACALHMEFEVRLLYTGLSSQSYVRVISDYSINFRVF